MSACRASVEDLHEKIGKLAVAYLAGAWPDIVTENRHHAFMLPVICYLYILFYALSGSKPNTERYARG